MCRLTMEDREPLSDCPQDMPVAELVLGLGEDMGKCVNLTAILIGVSDQGINAPLVTKVSKPRY